MVRRITSAQNDLVKLVRRLGARRSCRREAGLFVAEGRRLVGDALESGMAPYALLAGERAAGEGAFGGYAGDVYILPDTLIDSLCDTQSPQGILGVFKLPAREEPCLDGERMILLCGLQDPGNVGTILRTGEALGVSRAVLTADCPDLYSPKVLRASMGGVFRLPVAVVDDAGAAVRALRAAGCAVWAAALGGARELGRESLSGGKAGRVCVAVGNEGNGLPEEIVALCDGAVRIPMRGRAESLNAAMAAGILLWEMMRGA